MDAVVPFAGLCRSRVLARMPRRRPYSKRRLHLRKNGSVLPAARATYPHGVARCRPQRSVPRQVAPGAVYSRSLRVYVRFLQEICYDILTYRACLLGKRLHEEIIAFPRANKGRYQGKEWELIVVPVVKKWIIYVQKLELRSLHDSSQ